MVAVTALRPIERPFIAEGPSGVAIHGRIKGLTAEDQAMLWRIGAYLGSLAAADLKRRCDDGPNHNARRWAERKRDLTAASSSRWAGAITKANNHQWALARRNQAACITQLEGAVRTLRHRLRQPVGSPGTRREPGGYRSSLEWREKSRRLACLEERLSRTAADRESGRLRVVRGGKALARNRHHLEAAELSEAEWRLRWESARLFLTADGESGRPFGNDTIRVTDEGRVEIKLPVPLEHLANAPRGRYALAGAVKFGHRGEEWRGRVCADQAVAYRIRFDPDRDRWYLTASWKRAEVPVRSLDEALANGCIGVDANNDHLAAWRLDRHGNPVGDPRRFPYDLSGSADHRDAQVRHALSSLMRWANSAGVRAIAIEDLDFAAEKTREKHGRRKGFRRLISRFPTAKLKARLTAMAAEGEITVVAVDPAYTSKWGAEHWRRPMTAPSRKTTRHDAASIVIGRRAQGHKARRRVPPPHGDRSDRRGHRSIQAEPGDPRCEESRLRHRGPPPRAVSPQVELNAGDQCAQHRSAHVGANRFAPDRNGSSPRRPATLTQ